MQQPPTWFELIKSAITTSLKTPTRLALAVAVAINILFVYYFILIQTTTWEVFWLSNVDYYNYLQIFLSLATAAGFGVVVTMMLYVIEARIAQGGSWLTSVVSLVFSGAATGCTVCGAILLPTLGIAASLTALPFGGLEIKLLSLLLIFYAIYEYSKVITGVCRLDKGARLVRLNQGQVELNLNRESLSPLVTPVLITLAFVAVVYALPKLPAKYKLSFQRSVQPAPTAPTSQSTNQVGVDTDDILAQINPAQGYQIEATYGDLGPKMIKAGVIDLDKFKSVYENSGQPLTDEQLKILTQGSNQKITISSSNAYFLLNFFWAAGLANRNRILTEGEITKYGQDQIGYFASTGGWTLAKGKAVDYLAKSRLIPLTPAQEALVERVSSNIYRPCCNNPTSFPDCNHGMALLGVLQLMAASGASEAQMYQAAKYFNAFWFPQSYYDLAVYFKATKGWDFDQIDPKELLGKNYSSVSGWQRTKKLLAQKGLIKQAPKTGGGCGV